MMDRQASRRLFLRGLGGFGALTLLHCAGSDSSGAGATSANGADTGSASTDGDSSTSSSSASDGAFPTDASITASSFAVGSGAFLVGKDYGNPFTSDTGTTCTVYKSATGGPCHSNTYERKDVSDGLTGLPTRIELLVVDGACNPVANAIVEIWYASPAGTYSKAAEQIDNASSYQGSLSDLNVGFCTGNNAEAIASSWLRGFQKTDANGRVTLDGIFPGWYSGRAPHVHFIVTASGKTTKTSQLLLDETLTTAVYTQHSVYKSRGDKDTSNSRDSVGLGTDAVTSYAQQSDGAIVLWKKVTIS